MWHANIIAWAPVVSAIAAIAVAFIAAIQLPLINTQLRDSERHREEERKKYREQTTIEICARFTMDPTLVDVQRKIHAARNGGQHWEVEKLKPVAREIRNLLNYFDMIAIGVEQGVYDFDIVYDYLRYVITDSVDHFIFTNPRGELCKEEHYQTLFKLYQRIQDKRSAPSYRKA